MFLDIFLKFFFEYFDLRFDHLKDFVVLNFPRLTQQFFTSPFVSFNSNLVSRLLMLSDSMHLGPEKVLKA
jgi:hypothetical protein